MPRTLSIWRLARLWVLAWFVASIGVSIASPLVHPQSLEVICSGSGAIKWLVQTDDGVVEMGATGMDCPLCALANGAPPPSPAPPHCPPARWPTRCNRCPQRASPQPQRRRCQRAVHPRSSDPFAFCVRLTALPWGTQVFVRSHGRPPQHNPSGHPGRRWWLHCRFQSAFSCRPLLCAALRPSLACPFHPCAWGCSPPARWPQCQPRHKLLPHPR